MVTIGYALSSEEHDPTALVEYARQAEQAGFPFALVSDHFHPWTEKQGEAPFVWGLLGAMARATDELRVGTGVTCPLIRTHPAIIAQASATAAVQFEDRFFLGLGTGERLNEHVLGDRWPPHHVRLRMLEEAIELIRELWDGEMTSHDGRHYTVENAQLFTTPEEPPPIAIAAGGEMTARFAGRFGDALVTTSPNATLVDEFQETVDGEDAPRYGQVTVCYADSIEAARQTALEWWPNSALPGQLTQELATPRHFEEATEKVTEEDVAEAYVCSPDADAHIAELETYVDAGYDHVYVHQVGPEQAAFLEFYENEVLPSFA